MEVISGEAIGPLSFHVDLVSVKQLFPDAQVSEFKANSESGRTAFVSVKGLNISYCNEKPQDIWVELDEMPKNCLRFKGRAVPWHANIDRLRRQFGGCKTEISRDGGIFYECAPGLRIGVGGLAKYVTQIRIGPSLEPVC